MSELSIEERVIKTLENLVFQGFTITETSKWDEIGLDSIAKIEMMMDMEDEFNIDIPDEVMNYLEAVDDMVGYIERILCYERRPNTNTAK